MEPRPEWFVRESLDREIARAVRHGRVLSVVLVEVVEAPDPTATLWRVLEPTARTVRSSDIAGFVGDRLCLVLPEADGSHATAAVARLMGAAGPEDGVLRAGISTYRPDSGLDVDGMLFEAENALHEARTASRPIAVFRAV